MKAGRNIPCPCGSGRKYKHCCQAKETGAVRQGNTGQPAQAAIAQMVQTGIAHHNAGQLAQAEAIYRQVLQIEPAHPDALNLLGLIAYQTGQNEQAANLIRRAISANKRVPDYHHNLGNILIALGRFAEAEASLREALILAPSAEVHNNLGSALQRQGRIAEAIECYRWAVKLKPDSAVRWNNLGGALQLLGAIEEAILCYRRALEFAPDYVDAMFNLGNAFCDQYRFADATTWFENVLRLQPNLAIAHNNLGHALQRQGRLSEALACFRAALTINPDFGAAWQNYLYSLSYAAGYGAQEIFEEHVKFGRRLEEAAAGPKLEHRNERNLLKRIKIGYVSPDFRAHAVAYFIEPVLAHHNREQVEVYCYYNHSVSDEVTLRLKSLVEHWRDISAINDAEAAKQIWEDGVDILVDLAGHSAGNRLAVFARKSAPVQATWLSYVSTTGLGSIDYRITDVSADPVGLSERYYTEELVRLPDAFVCYRPTDGSPAVGALPAVKSGHITFGSFNNLAKMTPEVRSLWARVLLAVPGSRLMLKTKGLNDARMRQQLVEDFARQDVPEDRLELVAWDTSYAEHLNRYNQVDIGLDPFPCNGGTTSFDAMWMGVPVVTLAGDSFISRMGVSMLTSLGMTELVAAAPEDYVAIAARLAGDLERLAALRAGLRKRMANSPLTDAKRFTLNLETAYREMWAAWCRRSQEETR